MKKSFLHPSSLQDFIAEIRQGSTVALAQAITLVESRLPNDRTKAHDLIEHLLPFTGNSMRIGVTGVPGVGKSSFIEIFGKHLTSLGKKVAVLAIDPTSDKTKGSILGDKTRMEELSKDPLAFIRPTATGNALGGVADKTREAILLCEAAGHEVIIVETVGVGQSETAVSSMVDFFLLLLLAGAGDELQGIKKGIMEMADGVVITKADGENLKKAKLAQAEFQQALHLFRPAESGWYTPVLTSSALEKKGIAETWKMIDDFHVSTKSNGYFVQHRKNQQLQWFHESIMQLMREEILRSPQMKSSISEFEEKILHDQLLPSTAAKKLIEDFLKH